MSTASAAQEHERLLLHGDRPRFHDALEFALNILISLFRVVNPARFLVEDFCHWLGCDHGLLLHCFGWGGLCLNGKSEGYLGAFATSEIKLPIDSVR